MGSRDIAGDRTPRHDGPAVPDGLACLDAGNAVLASFDDQGGHGVARHRGIPSGEGVPVARGVGPEPRQDQSGGRVVGAQGSPGEQHAGHVVDIAKHGQDEARGSSAISAARSSAPRLSIRLRVGSGTDRAPSPE